MVVGLKVISKRGKHKTEKEMKINIFKSSEAKTTLNPPPLHRSESLCQVVCESGCKVVCKVVCKAVCKVVCKVVCIMNLFVLKFIIRK